MHAGAPPRRGRVLAAQADAAVEDQTDLVGAAEIEVVADQLLEEHAARVGAVSTWVSENSACRIESS